MTELSQSFQKGNVASVAVKFGVVMNENAEQNTKKAINA